MNVFMFFGPNQIAETVGFEPTCRLPDNLISSQARYDHFDTSPYLDILSHIFYKCKQNFHFCFRYLQSSIIVKSSLS